MINFEAFFKISYGLYVITSGNKDKANGYIGNTAIQVTSSPAQFAICCNKDNFTSEYIKESGVFAISVLKQEAGASTIGNYGYKSGRDFDKMESATTIIGETGVPIVTDDAIAYIECKLKSTLEVDTHILFIGEVVSADVLTEDAPITYDYYRNVKKGMAPKNAPTYIDKSKLSAKEPTPEGDKYKCSACGYIYDPVDGDSEGHIEPGTKFEDIPDDWTCPLCGAEKEDFVKI